MAGDAELERLKTEQDRAFQSKQAAWQAQDQAWSRRSAAREPMQRAYLVKQSAYEKQESSWRDCERVQSSNGPRIEALNAQQEAAFENMKRAFERASNAYESRDGESAKSFSEEGHSHKADSQAAVAERRRLVQECRDARERHDDTKPAFQRAKSEFDRVKADYDRAKADHEQKQAEFRRTKADFDRAKTAFQARLAVVKSESKKRKDDKRALAEHAGVPNRYLDDVWISTDPDGTVNIYFGGAGTPDGPGHGHYALDSSGSLTYRREPFDPHGSQNFKDVRYPRAQGSNWYSKWRSDDSTAQIMYDKAGNVTTGYPHVHVIHDDLADQIRVVASWGPRSHSRTTVLAGDASGNDVNAAVDELRRQL